MNRRSFLSLAGAALALPYVPKRVYSFFDRSDSAYLQGLLDRSTHVSVPYGVYTITEPLIIRGPGRVIHFNGGTINVAPGVERFLEGREGSQGHVCDARLLFDGKNPPWAR